MLLYIAISCVLVAIAVQDFRHREVYWWLFPLLAVLAVVRGVESGNWQFFARIALFNIMFVLLQFAMLWIYFSIKHRRLNNFINVYLGMGDVLMFLCLALLFSTVNFIFFFVIGLILILLYYLIAIVFFKKQSGTLIPLAGMQALMAWPLMIASAVLPGFNLFDDSFCLTYITRI